MNTLGKLGVLISWISTTFFGISKTTFFLEIRSQVVNIELEIRQVFHEDLKPIRNTTDYIGCVPSTMTHILKLKPPGRDCTNSLNALTRNRGYI